MGGWRRLLTLDSSHLIGPVQSAFTPNPLHLILMHLLPCPNCQTPIPVSPSQAGNRMSCPSCQSDVDIPKLGELRRLSLAEEPSSSPGAAGADKTDRSIARGTGFLVLGLIATASLLIAGFCGIRWVLIDVPTTTEGHIAEVREQYRDLTAAQLIREYEQMERYGIDLVTPYGYKKLQIEKDSWGRNASIAGAVGGLAFLGAFVLAITGGRNRA